MSFSCHLASSVESPGIARDAVTQFLAESGLTEQAIADVELVTSELVANAAAASSPSAGVDLRVGLGEGGLRIEVDDDGPGRPAVRSGTERGGFGLQVVEALSECWGTDLATQHKTVWAVLDVS